MRCALVPRHRGDDRFGCRGAPKARRRSATGRTARSRNAAIGDGSAAATGQNLCGEVLVLRGRLERRLWQRRFACASALALYPTTSQSPVSKQRRQQEGGAQNNGNLAQHDKHCRSRRGGSTRRTARGKALRHPLDPADVERKLARDPDSPHAARADIHGEGSGGNRVLFSFSGV